jgi:hypothetical protein
LVRILNLCLQFKISVQEIDEIELEICRWVVKYEECIPPFCFQKSKANLIYAFSIYYQHRPKQLPAYLLTIYVLLHIPDQIR